MRFGSEPTQEVIAQVVKSRYAAALALTVWYLLVLPAFSATGVISSGREAGMTAEERFAEMKRRVAKRKKNK
jgi:hypothetical protein